MAKFSEGPQMGTIKLPYDYIEKIEKLRREKGLGSAEEVIREALKLLEKTKDAAEQK